MKRLLTTLLITLTALAVLHTAAAPPTPPFHDVMLSRPGMSVQADHPVSRDPVNTSIKMVFVQSPGEEFTQAEQMRRIADIREAMQWWTELSPITTTLQLTSTELITTTYDAVTEWDRLVNFSSYRPGELTIYVIDNTARPRSFPVGDQTAVGLAFLRQGEEYGPMLVLVEYSWPSVDAHELGHALYGLWDLYFDDRPAIDIMDTWMGEAYDQRFIGWQSLNSMGVEERRTYLPIVMR